MKPVVPPKSEGELIQRARGLSGHTLGELAQMAGQSAPENLRRAKGWVGRLIEECLGAPGGNFAGPDFKNLGVELKTLPVDARGKVKESTYLCTVDLLGEEPSWERSRAKKKLDRILWIPVRHGGDEHLTERLVGHPVLWSPDEAEDALLSTDWNFHMDLIRRGLVDTITGHDGRVLQIRPKAANANSMTWTVDERGESTMTLPRGFYLRPTFTASILRKYFHHQP